jgi:hypothetical protein
MRGAENRPMTKREASTEIMMQLSELSIKSVRYFIEANKIFKFIFLFNRAAYNNIKLAAHYYKFNCIGLQTNIHCDLVPLNVFHDGLLQATLNPSTCVQALQVEYA